MPGRGVAGLWTWPLIGMFLVILVTGFFLRSTVGSILTIWYGSNTYSYGFIIIPIAVLLAWRRRNRLSALRPTVSLIGMGVFLLFAVGWLAGNVADVQEIQQVAYIGLIAAAVWAFLGTRSARVLAFPLLFLFLCVPAGESLIQPLQRLTAAFTVNALRLSGIPAVQDGLILSTPSGDWKIAEACSGIRYLTSSIVVGVLVAGVAFRSWKRRLIIVLMSAIVPVIANALRAYLIVVLAYVSNNRIATGVDHVVYGWIFFSLVTAILVGAALGWREPDTLPTERFLPPLPSGEKPRIATPLWCAGILIAIAMSAAFTSDLLWSRSPVDYAGVTFWSAPSGWIGVSDPDHDWTPDFSSVAFETFRKNSAEVSLYIATSTRNKRGMELVNSSNAVDTSGEWRILNSGYRETNISRKPVTVSEYLISSGRQHRLVWMWYLIGDQVTSNPHKIKLIQAKTRLEGHPASTFLFAISAVVDPQSAQATSSLDEFAKDLPFPELPPTPNAADQSSLVK
jgi:exosortase A